jgi:hypothetical protein
MLTMSSVFPGPLSYLSYECCVVCSCGERAISHTSAVLCVAAVNVRISSDVRCLYAIGELDDWELLGKQLAETHTILASMQRALRRRLREVTAQVRAQSWGSLSRARFWLSGKQIPMQKFLTDKQIFSFFVDI